MGSTKKAKKARTKRKQAPKVGKVIRVSQDIANYIAARRRGGETWGQTLERIIAAKPNTKPLWSLPSRLYRTKSEALGVALADAASSGAPMEARETPVKVTEATP